MAQIRRVAIAHARAALKDLVDDVKDGQQPVKLTRYNRTLAGIVPASDLHLLEECKRALADGQPEKPGAKRTASRRRPGPTRKP